METEAVLPIMDIAVGVALFAQPDPGAAEAADFMPLRQAEIFVSTLRGVFGWPAVLYRPLGGA
jgi:hypothetical protein